MNISRLFILRPVATLLLTLALVLLGVVGYRLLPVASLPQVDFPTIMVSASLPGASPETMAATVASPLERTLGQIAGITELSSRSSQGSTRLIIQFDLNRNIDGAARDVQAAINAAQGLLPTSMPSLPTYRKANPSDAPILGLVLTSDLRSSGELYDLAYSKLQQKIAQVNGVGSVSVSGSALPAVRIELKPQQLTHYGLALDTVRAAVANSSTALPKGYLQGEDHSWMITSNGQLLKAADYRNLVVSYQDGQAVHLGDVANVYDSVEDQFNQGYYNQQPAVMMMITRQAGSNMLETTEAVKALLPQLRASIPADISLQLVIDRSGSIRSSLNDTQETLLIAVALVIGVVFVFLRNFNAMLIPALALPVSLVGTFAFMYLFGYSLDILSLMALIIATGFVVDDAIVVLENIMRYIERGYSPLRAALKGAKEVGFTVLSMTLSLVAVFIPILLMGGIVGRLFREFAVTLTVALVISMVVSVTLTPMLCARLLRRQNLTRVPNRLYRAIEAGLEHLLAGYERGLHWVLRHPRWTLLSLLLTIVLNVFLYSAIQKGFFPNQDTGLLIGALRADQNVSFQSMRPKVLTFSKLVESDPDVAMVAGSTGSGAFGSRNSANLFVTLKPADSRTANASEIANRLMAKARGLEPGVQLFLMPAQDLRVGGRSANASYQYSLMADDLALLRTWTPQAKAALAKLPELTSVDADAEDGGQSVMLTIDRDKASRLGLSVKQLDTFLTNAFSQRQVVTLYQTWNQYHVVLGLTPEFTQEPEVLNQLQLVNDDGEAVPLSAFAQLSGGTSPLSVSHQGQSAASTIAFDLADGVSLQQAQAAIQTAMVQIGLPDSLQREFAGTAKQFSELTQAMPWLILAALLAVYIVLGMLYESFIHPLTILSTLPSAGVGALLLLILTGQQLTVIALIGILLLIGIVKKNAIMMIDFALMAERQQGLSPEEAILKACLMRFRPIMMTTLAAFFGALPLAISTSGDADLRSPLGIAITGGLALSQLLTLFTTPVVYLYLDRLSQGGRAFWQRFATR
ncbi:efflux RND transporter permease subunit [Pseudaeromonas paramecii]|uniref:Multidrug efflux RND transporter permease subunit n=1 Tax=Pseudaeromonas paramecii TaxID=2138166 RepID=A0ABP8QGA4_9GAMM